MSNATFEIGPLESLLEDPNVLEVMINRFDEIYVEKHGTLEKTAVRFDDEAHLRHIINGILAQFNREATESSPIIDVRLADGTLMNVVSPPVAVGGMIVTIRKFTRNEFDVEDLIEFGSWTQEVVDFLAACVRANLNLVVAGGTGSGKTTVFNVLSQFIGDEERVVLTEHLPEIQLRNKHVVRMTASPPHITGSDAITVQELVRNAMKMRPERIIVGEMRGGEALEILEAMNTGHDGSMFTIHANSVRDVLQRLEVMATMAAPEVPLLSIREQIGSAIDIIVQQNRLRDGKRKIMQIAEVIGTESGQVVMQNIFEFVQTDTQDGRIIGVHTPTGVVPKNLQVLQDAGFTGGEEFFNNKV